MTLPWSARARRLCVIPKAASEAHQRENLDLFGFALGDDEMSRIDKLSANRSVYKFRDPDAFS